MFYLQKYDCISRVSTVNKLNSACLLLQTCLNLHSDCFPRKCARLNMCAHLLYAVPLRWWRQGNCDAFRVFTTMHSVVIISSFEAPCWPSLKHLRCSLPSKVTQTTLCHIRCTWLFTYQQLPLVAFLSGRDSWHLAWLKRISGTFASPTYFISAGNIKESLIHGEGEKARLSWLFWWCQRVLLPVYRKTTWREVA